MATTHIAGLDVTVNGTHLRQRCAWCGTVLVDQDLTRVAVAAGSPAQEAQTPGDLPDWRYPTWPVGEQVTVDGGLTFVVKDEKLVDDSCARLPPEITAGTA